jgi:hypothetical protein
MLGISAKVSKLSSSSTGGPMEHRPVGSDSSNRRFACVSPPNAVSNSRPRRATEDSGCGPVNDNSRRALLAIDRGQAYLIPRRPTPPPRRTVATQPESRTPS